MPRVVHFEIHATEPQRARKFYGEVFGWTFNDWGDGAYSLVTTGEGGRGIDGGMMVRRGAPPIDGQPVNAFVCTVDVPSLDAYIDRVVDAGGILAVPRAAVPGVGWLAYVKDPDGNLLGMMEDDPTAR
jgi:predicted enzyme related to lactoylglutathione lyase